MKRWGLWIAGILAVASGSAAWTAWRGQLGTSLADEIAAAKREGVPVDPSDLIEPNIPDSKNGERAYLTAVAHTKSVMDGSMWSQKFSAAKPSKGKIASLSTADRNRLKALIVPLHPAIDALRRTSQYPQLVLHRSHDLQADYSDISRCRHLIRAIATRAELNSLEGDWRSGLADLEMSARVSALFATSLTSYDASMRSQIEKEILETIGRITAKHANDPNLPPRIRAVVDALGPPPEPRRVLADFAWSSRQLVAYFAAGGDSCTPGDPWLKLRSIREANEAQIVSHWRRVYRTLPRDPYDFDGLRRCLEDADTLSESGGRLRTIVPAGGTASYTANLLATNEARRRVARGAADVLQELRRTGRRPKSSADPFGGQLRYRVDGSECAVYSVDFDRNDNGGVLQDAKNPEGDIVWRFPLPIAKVAVRR